MSMIKYTVRRTDGEIETWEEPHGNTFIGRFIHRTPKIVMRGGERWIILRPSNGASGDYHIARMPTIMFRYRLWRSLHFFEHIGLQYIWLEGNPEIYRFGQSEKCPNCEAPVGPAVDVGPLTAQAIFNVTEADPIDRVYAPRRTDWVMVMVIGAMTGLLGFIVGAALGGI